jgi:hypothetical protein
MIAVANASKTYPRKHFGTRCLCAESKERKGQGGGEQRSHVVHQGVSFRGYNRVRLHVYTDAASQRAEDACWLEIDS